MFESYAFPKGAVRKMSCFPGTREMRKPGQEKPAVGRDRQLPGGARAGKQSSKTWEQTKLMKFSLQELSSHLEALSPAQLAPPPRLQRSPPALSLSWSVLPAETLPAAAGSHPRGGMQLRHPCSSSPARAAKDVSWGETVSEMKLGLQKHFPAKLLWCAMMLPI